jgi:hypothetical protein
MPAGMSAAVLCDLLDPLEDYDAAGLRIDYTGVVGRSVLASVARRTKRQAVCHVIP